MTAETKALPAPVIKEATNNQLKLSDLDANATAQVVISGTGFTVGSKVELVTELGSGAYRVSATVENVPGLIELLIPKDFFEKNLVSDSRAHIYYTVTTGQNKAKSPVLELTVVK
jgi:zona occludens toxin (predicted ATPase)